LLKIQKIITHHKTTNNVSDQNIIKFFNTGFLGSMVAMGSITWSNDSTNVEPLSSSITILTLNLI
jgi:hypothetical protein